MKAAMVVWQAMTEIHAGTGQDSSSVIDLPVAREGATGFPIVPGSTIKGVMRDGVALDSKATNDENELKTLERFGYTDKNFFTDDQGDTKTGKTEKRSRTGDLGFFDARLFALAIPSYYGVFALVTCPMVVTRLNVMRAFCDLKEFDVPEPPTVDDNIGAAISQGSKLAREDRAIVHDYDFATEETDQVSALANAAFGGEQDEHMDQKDRLMVVPDDVFSFLCETALPVMAHNRLDPDTKTVLNGALWYQENLPAESILTSFFSSRRDDESFFEELKKNPYAQFGGKVTTGHGLVRQLGREEVAA